MVLLPFVMEKSKNLVISRVDHNLHHLIMYKHHGLKHKLDNHIKLLVFIFHTCEPWFDSIWQWYG
jgi:hypothetical protein